MKNISHHLNKILFFISILLLGGLIYLQIANNVFMPIETFSIVLISISIIFKTYRVLKGQLFLLVAFFVLLFIKIDFSYTIENGSTSVTYHSLQFNHSLINPIVFILIFIFIVLNIRDLVTITKFLKNGSQGEQLEEFNRKVDFYYAMFIASDPIEFDDIYLKRLEYPNEAREAILRIKEERKAI